MSPDLRHTHFDLLVFGVPGLPDLSLALALNEVLGITALVAPTPIPLAPPALLGLSKWHNSPFSVVDLAQLLCGQRAPWITDPRYLVARVAVNTQLDYVAWPILPGATIYRAAAQSPRAEPSELLNPALVRASINAGGHSLILLNLDQLSAIVGQEQTKLHNVLLRR
jgi:chemotaxis signal transduction protein